MSLCFRWPADQVESLHSKLLQHPDLDHPARFEYDYQSNTVSLKITEKSGHSQYALVSGLTVYSRARGLALTIPDETVREQAKKIVPLNTARVYIEGKIWKQPDSSFASLEDAKATMVCEVS